MPERVPIQRRPFVAALLTAVASMVALPRRAWAAGSESTRSHMSRARGPHPKPRPGITAARMMTPEQLARRNDVADAFEGVRAIPQVIDGLRCHCGCAEIPGFYSLLTCYEGSDAMALICPICQGEGRMAARLHKEGSTLEEIRAALDAKYG